MITKRLETYKGHTALITGGASGIGLEFARILARSEWNLILVGRTESKLVEAQKSLVEEYGVSIKTKTADLSQSEEAYELFNKYGNEDPHVFLLINNAGTGLFGEVLGQSPAELARMIELNITSLTTLSTLFGKEMAEQGGGYILNVGSLAGRSPMPFFASYGASKSYVHNFTVALRAELADKMVHLTCLEPGYVRTSFDSNAKVENESYLRFSERNAMSPKEVAEIGLRGLLKGKARVVPGTANRLVAALASHVPPSWSAGLIYRSLKKMIS